MHKSQFISIYATKKAIKSLNYCLTFDITPFSAIDDSLPRVIFDATQIILNIVGVVAITAVVNPVFLVPVFFMAIVFVFIRKAYLKTSRSVKRLESNGNYK